MRGRITPENIKLITKLIEMEQNKELSTDKQCDIHDVSKSFASGKKAIIIDKKANHNFEIGETVTLVLKEQSGLWKAYNEKRGNWWIDELDANVC